jgi:hypothetical protein
MSVAAQLTANMTVASPAAAAAVWEGCFPDALTKLSLTNLDSVHGPVAMALLICCKDSRERWAGAWCWEGRAGAAAACQPGLRAGGAMGWRGWEVLWVERAGARRCAHARQLWPNLGAGWCCALRRCQQLCSPAGQTVLQAVLGAVMDPSAPQDAPGNE